MPVAAPDAFDPVEPTLFNTPCKAIGLSDANQASSDPVALGKFCTGDVEAAVMHSAVAKNVNALTIVTVAAQGSNYVQTTSSRVFLSNDVFAV